MQNLYSENNKTSLRKIRLKVYVIIMDLRTLCFKDDSSSDIEETFFVKLKV